MPAERSSIVDSGPAGPRPTRPAGGHPGRTGRDRLRLPGARDIAVATGAGLLDLLVFSDLVERVAAGAPAAVTGTLLLCAVQVGLLGFRRQRPGAVLVLLCVHSAVAGLLLPYRPLIGVCVGLATLAATGAGRATVLGQLLATLTSLTWVANEVRTSHTPLSGAVQVLLAFTYAVLLAVPTGIGRWHWRGQGRVRELERRRVEAARLAVRAERRRMARELHDVVAHAVTVMVVQAAGARRVLGTDQAAVATALAAVEDVGTESISELRRLLGVLRTTDDTAEDDADPAETGGPGTAELPALVARMRELGLRVAVRVHGTPGRLDPSVDRTGYRMVQEALTNAGRHAGSGAAATVTLSWQPRSVAIEVVDDGGGSEGGGRSGGGGQGGGGHGGLSTGHGLLGLAERVALVGGTLKTGRLPAGGYRLLAVLPTAAPSPAGPDREAPR
jgi:signal transduction histidine kinase